ncbi:MAG: hypothetical protein ACO3A1_06220 [Flavobacteriaceae bacterium]
MKRLWTSMACCLLFIGALSAQTKVSEKDVWGTWRFHLKLQEVAKSDSADLNFIEKAVVGAVSGIVDTAMEQVDIQFHFKKSKELVVVVHEHETKKKTEETIEWFINKEGQLEISDLKNDRVNIDNDGVWMLLNRRLVPVEKGKATQGIYLERLP